MTRIIKPELSHEDLIIGTHPGRNKTGKGSLCTVLDIKDDDGQRVQFVVSSADQNAWKMYDEFMFTGDTNSIRAHEHYKPTLASNQPFLSFKFGDKIEFLRNDNYGVPVFIGKHRGGEHVLVAYIFASFPDEAPRVAYKLDEFMSQMDAGNKSLIKVKYLNHEDELVTKNVATLDEITDMKQLIYKLG